MSKIVETIESLDGLIKLKPATKSQIREAEQSLKLKFASEYKEYLEAFGAITADGIELTGITKSNHVNVVYQTKKEWDLNENVPHNMYVVENLNIEGIIIWQDSKGAIYRSRPNHEPKRINKSLAEYVEESQF